VSANPFSGAFPHQHHDPRGLAERIEAQLRERIEEAVEMAGLKLMVDLRERHHRPAPETSSEADRREFEQITTELLQRVRDAFRTELGPETRAEMDAAAANAQGTRACALAGHVFLARRLPDYWQRFDAHQADYARQQLEAPEPKRGWLGRLFSE
jgi:hypothetical protein